MADNTLLNSGAGGDTIRDIDRAGVKTQVIALDTGGAAGERLVNKTTGIGMPIEPPAPIFWSSVAALAANATITSQTFDTSTGQQWIGYAVNSSTAINVFFDESADNTNWYNIDNYVVGNQVTGAGGANYTSHKPSAQYCRIRFTNVGANNPGGAGNLLLAANQGLVATETDVAIADKFGNGIGSSLFASIANTYFLQVALPSNATSSATAPSVIDLVGSQANANAPTYNEGTAAPISSDLNGRVRTRDDLANTYNSTTQSETLTAILIELRTISKLLKQGMNVSDELYMIRQDEQLDMNQPMV